MTPDEKLRYLKLFSLSPENNIGHTNHNYYLDYRIVLADIRKTCIASRNKLALANKALISVSSPTRRSLADSINPELTRVELPQRDERGRVQGRVLGRVRAHRVEYRKTLFDSTTSCKTPI